MNLYIKYFYNYASSGFSFDRALIGAIKDTINRRGRCIKVLDFGCGLKPHRTHFAAVDEYVGIDVYPGKSVDVVYDGKKIPFNDEYFDVVFSSSVLEHVLELEESLNEINRVLKQGGVMISVVPFINHVHGTPYDFHRPTRFGWLHLTTKVGFTFTKIIATDNRLQCVLNLTTAAINNSVYSALKKLRQFFKQKQKSKISIDNGGASPESAQKLNLLYTIMKLNPINFILGLLSLTVGTLSKPEAEGEITSGYLIVAIK